MPEARPKRERGAEENARAARARARATPHTVRAPCPRGSAGGARGRGARADSKKARETRARVSSCGALGAAVSAQGLEHAAAPRSSWPCARLSRSRRWGQECGGSSHRMSDATPPISASRAQVDLVRCFLLQLGNVNQCAGTFAAKLAVEASKGRLNCARRQRYHFCMPQPLQESSTLRVGARRVIRGSHRRPRALACRERSDVVFRSVDRGRSPLSPMRASESRFCSTSCTVAHGVSKTRPSAAAGRLGRARGERARAGTRK